MDSICLPVCYKQLTEEDVQVHLRYCARTLENGDRVEVLLSDAGVVVPIVKRVHQTQGSTLDFLIRSGSFGRDGLITLRARLASEGYNLKTSFTSKRRLLSRIVVPLPVDDPLLPLTGLGVLRSVVSELNIRWPCTIAIGYALGSEAAQLPGRLTYRDPLARSGYLVGQLLGRFIRKIILRTSGGHK